MKLTDITAPLSLPCPKDMNITGVSIDSRQLKPGNVFIAIQGERFDGHQFIMEAIRQGAAAIVATRMTPDVTIPQLIVPDTLDALTRIAAAYRATRSCRVIALTGSNGKTTVKEMIAAILPQPSFATPGNLNNHIGVPLSILKLQDDHRFAVFELGANHAGEIKHTVALVKPEVTLINNIAPAHIEGFGSIDGVANAKGEIYQGLVANGIAVINDDDVYAHFWDEMVARHQTLRFSRSHASTIHAKEVQFNQDGCGSFILVTPKGEVSITLQVPGAHNVSNALAAATCTYALNIPLSAIQQGLQTFGGVSGRMTFRHGKNNSLVIDDTYNANLRSSLTAIDVLSQRQGQRIFVLGDMGELGEWSEQHHQEIGRAARKQGIQILMTCGVQSEFAARAFGHEAKHYRDQNDLVQDLLHHLDSNTTVLVKGSRSSKMEKIVHELLE